MTTSFTNFKLAIAALSVLAVPMLFGGNALAAPITCAIPTACTTNEVQTAIDTAAAGSTLTLTSDIVLTHQLTINKSLTFDGAGHIISPTFTKTDNSNNSVFGIYNTDQVTITNLTISGAAGTNLHGIHAYKSTNVILSNLTINNNDGYAVNVNGSTVSVNGVSTSGNGWGGIDVDQGSGVSETTTLTLLGSYTSNETNSIFIDQANKSGDINVSDPLGQFASTQVTNGGSDTKTFIAKSLYTADYLQTIIDTAPAGSVITLGADATLNHQLTITKPLTINGSGFTLSPNFAKTDNSNNSVIGIQNTSNVAIMNLNIDGSGGTDLHGVNVYRSTGVTLNNMKITNNRYAILVNASTVSVGGITTSGNIWGGINVDKGTLANPASLTFTGSFTSNDSTPAIVVDSPSPLNTITGLPTNLQYSIDSDGKAVYGPKVTATPTTTKTPEVTNPTVTSNGGGTGTVAYSDEPAVTSEETEGETLGATNNAGTSSTSTKAKKEEPKKDESCSKLLGACWYYTTPIAAILLGGGYYLYSKRAGEV